MAVFGKRPDLRADLRCQSQSWRAAGVKSDNVDLDICTMQAPSPEHSLTENSVSDASCLKAGRRVPQSG